MESPTRPPGTRALLVLACVAVAFAAADTYVVVLALPDMMLSVGLSVNQLQRVAPIISGFLLGYVAMLPLIGRIADLRGRLPVLVGSLVIFAFGSMVTAFSFDLATIVTGRFLQGLGGGGLVPATLALVADLYPVHRRAVPLGVVSAVQEIGSVIGPLFGAVVLALADWEAIFWINLAVGLVMAAGLRALRSPAHEPSREGPTESSRAGAGRTRDYLSIAMALLCLAGLILMLAEPEAIMSDLFWGWFFVPVVGSSRWLAPLALFTVVVFLALLVRSWLARNPLFALRTWTRTLVAADIVGATWLGLSLAGIIVAFATADPAVQVFSDYGLWALAASATCAVGFWWHSRRTAHPLIPRGALRRTPAWASLLVSFFVGAALIAALTDIPVYARISAYPDSQLQASFVLVRFLVALPIGAVVGGWMTRSMPAGVVTAIGMLCAVVGFGAMTQWDMESLHNPMATVPLVISGLGFGLALTPVNAVLLAATDDGVHGVASALVVVARMVGMLVGISALTTMGLRRFYQAQESMGTIAEICGSNRTCPAYRAKVDEALLTQVHTIFAGAAVCAAIAAILALLLFRGLATTGKVSSAPSLG